MASKTQRLAVNLVSAKCSPPDVSGLTPEQQAALHVFKYEVLASLNRLYMVVPAQVANKIIDEYLPKP